MPRFSRRLILAAALAVLARVRIAAADTPVSIALDPTRTRIEWTLNGNVHEVHGTFRLKQGNFAYDSGSGKVQGELVADAASGESGNGARDKRMRHAILETERFPEVRFVPERFSAPSGNAAEFTTTVSGSFTLHGASHSLSVPMSVKLRKNEITLSGSFVIPYVAWGLKDPSTFLFRVDKDVHLHVTAVGRISE